MLIPEKNLRILTLLVEGYTYDAIARKLGTTRAGVSSGMRGVYRSLGLRTHVDAALWYAEHAMPLADQLSLCRRVIILAELKPRGGLLQKDLLKWCIGREGRKQRLWQCAEHFGVSLRTVERCFERIAAQSGMPNNMLPVITAYYVQQRSAFTLSSELAA